MSEKGIAQFLVKHAAENPVSFHMPGHKGRNLYTQYGCKGFNGDLLPFDITEIPGADNLFLTEGIIRETGEKYAKLYQVEKSYLLVNGTSCGLIAAIMATAGEAGQSGQASAAHAGQSGAAHSGQASATKAGQASAAHAGQSSTGGKLIMARNCHKSVFSGLRLAGVSPVYAFPSVIPEYGISGPVEPEEIERLLKENPDAGAVILPSPNYYGICSDIKAIAQVCHAHDTVLIVDQAHGAHLKMFSRFAGAMPEGMPASVAGHEEMPPSAEECGADIIVNSIHKTLLSFTQSAILNVNSDRIDQVLLEDKLQMMESTSPSYLLMASLDLNADILLEHGEELCAKWLEALNDFYARIEKVPGIRIMRPQRLMDSTKINIDMSAFGIDGNQLEQKLNEQGIYPELVTGNILMCMTGIGNTSEDLQRLADALIEIAEAATERGTANPKIAEAAGPVCDGAMKAGPVCDGEKTARLARDGAMKAGPVCDGAMKAGPVCDGAMKASPDSAAERETTAASLWNKRRKLHEIPQKKQQLSIDLCEGKICAASIIPYPPGIPLICPGEEISAEDIEYIKLLREKGEKVIGYGIDNTLIVGE